MTNYCILRSRLVLTKPKRYSRTAFVKQQELRHVHRVVTVMDKLRFIITVDIFFFLAFFAIVSLSLQRAICSHIGITFK